MAFIKRLDQLTPEDASKVGGKAYNCSRLIQAGFPVPDGFALPAKTVTELLFSDALDDQLARFPENTLFAVRSSAADEDSAGYSFAGIHQTRVNVQAEDIRDAIKTCLDSVHSPQALAYRSSQGLVSDQVETGILVQVMIKPQVSGVAFTSNPLSGESDELLINASWGLGEAVVSGLIEPDEFRICKSDLTVLSNHTGSKLYRMISKGYESHLIETNKEERKKSTLNSSQLAELSPLLRHVELFFGAPQDIEWCYDGAQFWIVQSRPITASASSSGPDIEWSRVNLCEILPDLPSPASELSINILDSCFRYFFGNLFAPEEELGPTVKIILGRPYINLSQLRRVCYLTRTPFATMVRQMGHEGEIKPEDEKIPSPPFLDTIRVFPAILRIARFSLFLNRILDKQNRLNKEDMDFLTVKAPQDMSNAELNTGFMRFIDTFPERLTPRLAIIAKVSLHEKCLEMICSLAKFPYEKLVHSQMAIGEKSVSAKQCFSLLALTNTAHKEDKTREFFLSSSDSFANFRQELAGSKFLYQFETFLQEYGHRGIYESEPSLPLYNEDPSPLLQSIRTHIQAGKCRSPEEIYVQQEEEANKIWQEFISTLPLLKRLFLVPIARYSIKKIKQLYGAREYDRSEMQRVVSMIRQYNLVLAQRFVESGWIEHIDDFYYAKFDEFEDALADPVMAGSLKTIIAERKEEYKALAHLEMPLLMYESEASVLMRRADSEISVGSIRQLSGLCVSTGKVEGEVVVIRDPSEFDKMKQGAILVAPATNPAWTPLFTLAAGVIVEIGGTLSHASIVAREYSLPALANVKNAVKLLKNGDVVRLDATNGLIEIVNS